MENKSKIGLCFGIIIILLLLTLIGLVIFYNVLPNYSKSNQQNQLENSVTNILEDKNTTSISNKIENTTSINMNNNIISTETAKSNTMSNSEALKIAKETYHSAYAKFSDGVDMGTVAKSGKNTYLVTLSNDLQNYFTSDGIAKILAKCNIDTTYHYTSINESSPFDAMIGTIFGQTDQSERVLTLVSCTDSVIVAKGKCSGTMVDGSLEGEADQYNRYIIFEKVNNKWLISSFD